MAQAKFGKYNTRVLANEATGAPRVCAIQAASGSVDAATTEATSILRGDAGRIIAATRMTTVFQERPRPPLTEAKPVQALSSATPAAFSTKYSIPASVFLSYACGAYRT